jgi:hypothetical protein
MRRFEYAVMFFLINMPLHSIERPCLPLSLFKALFKRENLASRVLHLNFLLVDRIGAARYNAIERWKRSKYVRFNGFKKNGRSRQG